MKKRIVTKIGDIFCVEVDNHWKCYFQYVSNDMTQLNSSVIRVFERHYALSEDPSLDEIVADKVAFYAHTMLAPGIDEGVWYKYGKSNEVDEPALKQVLFGTVCATKTNANMDVVDVNPLDNWRIWYVNQPAQNIGKLPKDLWDKIEVGSVFPYNYILDRIKYGYYRHTSPVFEIIKRIPYSSVDSYTRREEGEAVTFLHFKGDSPVQEIRASSNNPAEKAENDPLPLPKFWETNWQHKDFISEKEFNEAWSSPNVLTKPEQSSMKMEPLSAPVLSEVKSQRSLFQKIKNMFS